MIMNRNIVLLSGSMSIITIITDTEEGLPRQEIPIHPLVAPTQRTVNWGICVTHAKRRKGGPLNCVSIITGTHEHSQKIACYTIYRYKEREQWNNLIQSCDEYSSQRTSNSSIGLLLQKNSWVMAFGGLIQKKVSREVAQNLRSSRNKYREKLKQWVM